MGLFSSKRDKEEIDRLRKANEAYKKANASIRRESDAKSKRIKDLEELCEEKDSYFMEMISDGLRHGSKLAAKHMSDRKKTLNGK